MTQHYTVGMNINGSSKAVTVEAADALIAALKVKHENPAAMITYARKSNRRARGKATGAATAGTRIRTSRIGESEPSRSASRRDEGAFRSD